MPQLHFSLLTRLTRPFLSSLLPLLAMLLGLSASLAHSASEPLPPDKAYRVSANMVNANTAEIRVDIEKAYYLYRDKFAFATDNESVGVTPPAWPAGLDHTDNFFGRQVIYRDLLVFRLPLQGPAGSAFTLKLTHQGCADMGICYPPTEVPLALKLETGARAGASSTNWLAKLDGSLSRGLQSTQAQPELSAEAVAAPGSSPKALAPEEDATSIHRLLQGGNLALILVSFFGFGLLLCFTPCTLPMVPIISGIIVGHGHRISHRHAFVLSAAYVLGMAATYAAAGVLAGLSGTLLANWLQNAWVLGAFAAIFVILALAMFGAYELQLPSRWQHRLSASAHKHGGSPVQLAMMGAISALIVGPCVAAPLAGALLYIARSHDAVLGGLALFALALGMGLPLVIVGVAARRFLPKPGAWMEGVKRFFGVLLLATALWLVSPVLPPLVPMLGWAALLIGSGVFLRAIDPLPPGAHSIQRLFKAIGIIALLAGAAILIGALAGSRNPLQPLSGLRSNASAAITAPVFERIRTIAELDQKLAASTKPVMLDFYADWCVSCKEMEHYTFTDPAVARQLQDFTLLQADVTANTPDDRALLARFGLFGPPGIIFFGPGGKAAAVEPVIGFVPPERFSQILASLQNGP